MDGWRVETMVVGWRQVDYHVVHLVAAALYLLKHAGYLTIHWYLFILSRFRRLVAVALIAKHELVKSVGSTFHAVNGAVLSIDLAAGKNSAIAWRAHGLLVSGLIDGASIFFEASSEELRESLVVAEV